jgi:hypothetical protein
MVSPCCVLPVPPIIDDPNGQLVCFCDPSVINYLGIHDHFSLGIYKVKRQKGWPSYDCSCSLELPVASYRKKAQHPAKCTFVTMVTTVASNAEWVSRTSITYYEGRSVADFNSHCQITLYPEPTATKAFRPLI